MSDNEETQNIVQNHLLDYISSINTNNFFEKDILIQGSKIQNLEKEEKITLKMIKVYIEIDCQKYL